MSSAPEWSPDGTTIALTREEPDTYDNQLWLVRPDGSGAPTIGPSYEGDEIAGAWSPDGTQIAVETLEGLFIIEAGTGHSHAVHAQHSQTLTTEFPPGPPMERVWPSAGTTESLVVDPATGAGTALTHCKR